MKKIIFIAFAAILAGLTISCQKEIPMSEQNAASVQYSFNISVNGQFGFESEASTKGGGSATYKTAWTNGDRIFLFFKPASGSLLEDTFATLTYNGSTWGGSVSGSSSLGEGGTLSAVYVYNLESTVEPVFSDGKWTVASGNVFYNCQTGVSYTVSGSEISASLDLVAPADFVQFCVSGGASEYLTCNKVRGWKDVAIGSDMSFSSAICTGSMKGIANSGDSNVTEYYGRIVGGTSLTGVACKFSLSRSGKVYEHAATPAKNTKGFSMITSTGWTEAVGALSGLFYVAEDKWVRFSKGNLWYGPKTTGATETFNFEANQYDISSSWDASHVSNFYWSQNASCSYTTGYSDSGASTGDVLFTNADETTPKADFTANGQTGVWRTLSHTEWKYLFNHHSYKYVSVNDIPGIVIAPNGYSGTIAGSYDVSAWAEAEAAGFAFLPNTGFRWNAGYILESEISCFYWTSTAHESKTGNAYRMFFQWNDPLTVELDNDGERLWAIGIRLVSDCK